MTILVLDDEAALVDMLRSALERSGHRVIGATRFAPDLLFERWEAAILDLTIAGQDGRDVAARLEASGLARPRVALMTGMPDSLAPYRTFRKPFRIGEILSWVKGLEEA